MIDVRTHTLSIPSAGFCDIHDLTGEVAQLVRQEGLAEGSALLFCPGATAGLSTIEFESGAVSDLKAAIERLAPEGLRYAHDQRWGDGNGFSHVRAALMKPNLEVPVSGGGLLLGTWQQIVLLDFDNRPRQRQVVCQLRGIFADSHGGSQERGLGQLSRSRQRNAGSSHGRSDVSKPGR